MIPSTLSKGYLDRKTHNRHASSHGLASPEPGASTLLKCERSQLNSVLFIEGQITTQSPQTALYCKVENSQIVQTLFMFRGFNKFPVFFIK